MEKVNNLLSVNGAGFCTLCGKKSECKCDRCGDFYCSELCQRKDWSNHRFICFPLPKLVKADLNSLTPIKDAVSNDSRRQLSDKDAKPQSGNLLPNGSCVILTGFKSSNRCSIRSTNPSITGSHEKVLNDINELGKKAPALSEKPKNNSYALALRHDKWCRVQVLGNSKDNCYRISFLDFGDISKRNFKELRKIETSIVNLPCFVRKVQLKGISKISTQQNLLSSLVQFTNKEYKVEFGKTDKFGGNVELFQWGSKVLLNNLIENLCSQNAENGKDPDMDHQSVTSSSSIGERSKTDVVHAKKSELKTAEIDNAHKTSNGDANKSANKIGTKNGGELIADNRENKRKGSAPRQIQVQKPCLIPPFEILPLNENDHNSTIIVMDCSYIESGYIGCLLEKHLETLKEISKFIKEYSLGDQPYKPKFNEYCLANYEQEWYRAKVVEIISEDKFLVVYIDFTNEMELSSESIRRYPMSLTLPCCTTLCAIDGLPADISDGQKKFLESNCISFHPLKIDSVRVEDDIRFVKSNELLSKMHDSNLL